MWGLNAMVLAFQSTLPRRERPGVGYKTNWDILFQSTLPRRERRKSRNSAYVYPVISIHAPAKGATRSSGSCSGACADFNPRSREGSDSICSHRSKCARTFQSTLPRRERRFTSLPINDSFTISIHAPAKGATIKPSAIPSDSIISIHAPAKGATAPGVPEYNVIIIFQSTLPRRERLDTMTKGKEVVIISIHAPAKGAT